MITVAVCTYNRAERLGETIQSLLCSDVPPSLEWELLVVDNGCTEDTKEVVERLSAETKWLVRLVREPRKGLSHARNTAVRVARGDIIAFTDDDVIPESDWLTELEASFRLHDCAAVGGRVLAHWSFEPPRWWTATVDKLNAAIVSFDLGGEPRPIEIPPFGANMAFRTMVFDQYGGFRTDLGRRGNELISGEDTEFGLRLLDAGEVIWYAPNAIVHHPVTSDRATKSYFRKWYYHYGRTVIRHEGIPDDAPQILGVPRYLYRELAEAFLRSVMRVGSHWRFVHELQAWQSLGQITESRRKYRAPPSDAALGETKKSGPPSGSNAADA